MSDMGLEAPDADSAEQNTDAFPDDDTTDEADDEQAAPLEADEADTAEQERTVSVDDDEYR